MGVIQIHQLFLIGDALYAIVLMQGQYLCYISDLTVRMGSTIDYLAAKMRNERFNLLYSSLYVDDYCQEEVKVKNSSSRVRERTSGVVFRPLRTCIFEAVFTSAHSVPSTLEVAASI